MVTSNLMSKMGGEITKQLPKNTGFALIVFPFGDKNKFSNYISNAQRADMIKALRETANRLDHKQDFSSPSSN